LGARKAYHLQKC